MGINSYSELIVHFVMLSVSGQYSLNVFWESYLTAEANYSSDC